LKMTPQRRIRRLRRFSLPSGRGMIVSATIAGLVVLTAMSVSSCGKGPSEAMAERAFEIDQSRTRGPLTLSVKATRKEITIAERLTFVLQADLDEEYELEMPQFGDKLEQFGIVDYRTPLPRLVADGRTRYERQYVLEPFLSGEYKIPPMKVRFWKKREATPELPETETDGKRPEETVQQHELETDELTITVKSILPEDYDKLEIRPLVGPMELPRKAKRWLLAAIAGGFVLIAAVAGVVIRRRRRRREVEALPRIPAHELAYRQLEQLVAEKLIETENIALFYDRISGIMRHYIENRFGLRAPERTTEEFLLELAGNDALRPGHKSLLKVFLKHCDLVKFARHEPSTDEIQQTFDSCKGFIEATESDEVTVLVPSAA